MRRGHRDRSCRNMVVGVEGHRNRERRLCAARIAIGTAARLHLIVRGAAEANRRVGLAFFDGNLVTGNIGQSAGAARPAELIRRISAVRKSGL